MPLSARRSDDADVIRARLRRLLADAEHAGGWVPEDDLPTASREDGARGPFLDVLNRGPLIPARPGGGPVGHDSADDRDAAQHRSGIDAPGAVAPDEEARDVAPDEVTLPAGMGRHRSPGPAVRWSPGGPGARSLWLAGLGAALVLVVWTWLDRPRVEPAPAPAPPSAPMSAAPSTSMPVGEASDSSPTVVVSVVGLVARPGLVTLPVGARVADAVDAAGGLLPEADAAAINQAAVVSDGQQIAVGVPGAAPASPGGASDGPGGLVDLNSATVADLDALPGIGPVLAQRIVEHRTTVGRFGSVDELDDVPGIGPSIAAELAGRVTV